MKRLTLTLTLALLGAVGCWAQQAAPITTSQLTIPANAVSPSPPAAVNVTRIGAPGPNLYYYWVVADLPIGWSAPSAAALVSSSNGTLDTNNYNRVTWSIVTGATNYQVLRTTTSTQPAPGCTCATTGGTVTATSFNDQNNTLGVYSNSPWSGDTSFNVTNKVVGAGESQLTFAADHGSVFEIDSITGAVLPAPTLNNATLTGTTTVKGPFQASGGGEFAGTWPNTGTITGGAVDGASLGSTNSPITDIIAKGPWLDVRAYGASGSSEATTATCTASNTVVTLAAVEDFANGQGIALSGCGAAAFGGASVAAPTPSVVSCSASPGAWPACYGTAGSTTYNYKIAVFDPANGYSAAGSAGQTTTGNATLAVECCNQANANIITWSAPSGIAANNVGYLVYGAKGAGAYSLVGIVEIPGAARPWTASGAYAMGKQVRPTNANANGSYYVATTGGTSGATEPAWCTSSATCTVSDGSITWQRQPFYWMDAGAGSLTWAPAWIPQTPPSQSEPDALVTSITAGGGSTSLTLSAAPTTSQSGATLTHDDTAAIQAAEAASQASCLTNQPSGYVASSTCKPIWFPTDSYNVSSAISFTANLEVNGQENAIIYAQSPLAAIFSGAGWNVRINNLNTIGGRHLIEATAGSDASVFNLQGIDTQWTADYALMFVQGNGARATVSGRFFGDRGGAYTEIDTTYFSGWYEPMHSNFQPWLASFYETPAPGTGPGRGQQLLALDNLTGVGSMYLPYDRWIDNWSGAVDIDASRLDGDPDASSTIYTFAGAGHAPDWLGTSLTIRASSIDASNVGIIVDMNGTAPQGITFTGNTTAFDTQLVATCSGLNSPNELNPCVLPPGFTATNLDTAYNSAAVGSVGIHIASSSEASGVCWYLPPALMPYYDNARCAATNGVPVAGLWPVGGTTYAQIPPFVRNFTAASGNAYGYVLANTTFGTTVRASPLWAAAETYTLASSPLGEGTDYVTDGSGHTFYVSAVSSGSTCLSQTPGPPSWNTAAGGNTTTDGTCTWTYDTSAAPANWLTLASVGVTGTGVGVNATSPTIASPILTGTTTVSVVANGCSGTSGAMVAGVVTVTNACVTSGVITLTVATPGGTEGFLHVSSKTVGTGFTITSSSSTDTSTVSWVQN